METTKDIKKDVLITIKGTQKVGNEKDVIEMMTTSARSTAAFRSQERVIDSSSVT